MQHPSRTDVMLVEDLGQQRLPARSLAALLRRAGLSAQVVSFGPGDDPGRIAALAQRQRPRLIVLSILFAHLVAENLALVNRLRLAGVTAHLTMVGPLPSFVYAELLSACPGLDSVVRAPYGVLSNKTEASLVSLAAALRVGEDWQGIPGLAYRDPALRANPMPTLTVDLDDLPFPAWDEAIPECQGFGFATLEASRGCYNTCSFCLPCAFYRADQGPAYRLRSVPHLAEEMEALYRRGARLFLFDDEQFLPPAGAREERVRALAGQLQQRGLEVAFTIKCRADDVQATLFRELKAAGLVRVYLGVESGCQGSLDLLGKGVSAECNACALVTLDELGIVADLRCLLFHPWSTLETIQADLAFWEQVLPYVPTPLPFHEVECYPGTALAARLQRAAQERGQPGPGLDQNFKLAYTIADPRAELLRRLRHVVFGARDRESGLHQQISQAWYNLVLQQRFGPGQPIADQARLLRQKVAWLNRESLAVWREMLSFAASENIYDVGRVNARAAAWAGRVNALDMELRTGAQAASSPNTSTAVSSNLSGSKGLVI